jgi:hypothetical protein
MTPLQTFHLAHLPPDLAVYVALYNDVQNAPSLRDQLLQGNPDFEYALIDASVVCSRGLLWKTHRNHLTAQVDTINTSRPGSSVQSCARPSQWPLEEPQRTQ